MGYRKIPNLYKSQTVLLFKEVFVMEKIHGTSANIRLFKTEKEDSPEEFIYGIDFFSGGAKHDAFVALFNQEKLLEKFKETGCSEVKLYGEAYGGKLQGMSETYGKELKFIVFECCVSGKWLPTDKAEEWAKFFNLEFVWYTKCKAEVEILDKYRDQPSEQAKRNGMGDDKKAEGIVIRPIREFTIDDKGRILAKHKRADFSETRTKRKVADPNMLQILEDAREIAEEWVTPMRLTHVLDNLKAKQSFFGDMRDIPLLIKVMNEDIKIEAEGEIVFTKAAEKAIGKKTVALYKEMLVEELNNK